MEDNEKRLMDVEGKLKADLGDDHSTGQVWRTLDAHANRLSHLDAVIWQGSDSISAQILKIRTEIRTVGIALAVLIPAVMKALEWMAK